MLSRLFGAAIDPDRGVAFLENFLPGQAWVLAGIGARMVHVRTFMPQTYGHAKAFIAEQLRHNRELRVLMGAPNRMLTTAPLKDDLRTTRHIGIMVADARKAEIDAFARPPAILLKGPTSWIAVWRFFAPVHPDTADKAEAALVARYGTKRLNHFLPLPNLGGFKLVEFAKDRLAMPTDFWALPARDDSAERKPTSFSPAAAIRAEEIAWLWPEVAAKGALTLIAGQPGMGKSQIAIFIAATLSAGGIWPNGSRAKVGSAIVCETEDDPASVIRPRLEAAGADLNKIAFGPHLDLTRELGILIAQADTMPDLQLLVLSPIGSFFGASSYDDVTMRGRLKPLLDWAAKKQVAIVGLTHPPKQGSGDVFAGSDVYRKVARGAWSAITDPDDDEPLIKRKRRLLIGAKANNAPDTLRVAYRIEGVTLPSGIKTSRVVWQDDRAAFTADHDLSTAADAPEPKDRMKPRTKAASAAPSPQRHATPTIHKVTGVATTNAAAWLAKALKDGPRVATELKADALQKGLSNGSVYRAAKSLSVIIEGGGYGKPKTWRLP